MSREKKTRPMVIRSGNIGVATFASSSYSFEISGSVKMADVSVMPVSSRLMSENLARRVANFDIFPCGESNTLPTDMRNIFEANNLAEGVFKRQRGLLWGQGPALYTEKFVDGERKRDWIDKPEVMKWLNDFDYEDQLTKAIIDYYHMEGHFAKITPTREGRIKGVSKVASVKHVGYHSCRLEFAEYMEPTKKIIVGDWLLPRIGKMKAYPIFDPKATTLPISIGFYNMYSFSRDRYGLPAHFGTLDWIKAGSSVPRILDALTKNSLNVKWHIKSPQSYWMAKREELIRQCGEEPSKGVYKEKMLEDLKDQIFGKLAEVLSGEANVGKFFTSEKAVNELGNPDEWDIESIDQKVKEFVDSQVVIAKQADSAITSGMGLHPSLSNIIVDGKLASGSEQLYALKLYLSTEIALPETLICKPINQALAINHPGENLKVGFYHDVVKTEDQTTPANRVKNVV
ncbi:MAG: hypothetical protein WCO63_16035 [Bacteroidota bacterium]